jgi:hypothetical protein
MLPLKRGGLLGLTIGFGVAEAGIGGGDLSGFLTRFNYLQFAAMLLPIATRSDTVTNGPVLPVLAAVLGAGLLRSRTPALPHQRAASSVSGMASPRAARYRAPRLQSRRQGLL